MDVQELRKFKVELLDDIHEMSSDPVPDLEDIRRKVEAFFEKLETTTHGKEDRKT